MGKVIIVDKNGRSDGAAYNFLQKINTDIPIVLVSRVEDVVYNPELDTLKGKPYVLIDFVELGWNWDMDYGHHWAHNTDKFPEVFRSDGWKVFDNFVDNNKPIITFQRELLQESVSEKLVPICYPCIIDKVPLQSREQFNMRMLNVFFTWGLSNERRKWLHAKIWKKSSNYGYGVCDNIYYLKGFLQNESNPNKWFTCNIPHYCRLPVEEIMMLNGISKLSFSLPGAGKNCFRHSESPINSVMLMHDDETAWHQKDWVHNYNCVKCEDGEEIQAAIEALNNQDLYDIYVNGVMTVDKFRVERYTKEYIEPLIKSAL